MSHKKQTAGIILAAGRSKRFGRPKQLLKLKGKYLLEHVLNAAFKSKLNHLVLVLGHEYQKILQALEAWTPHTRLQVVINHRYLDGQSSSLQAGLLKIRESFSSVMFILGDQPMLNSNTIDHMLDIFRDSEKDICVPVCQGKRGNPTIFNWTMYNQLMAVEGDIGARDIIRTNPARVLKFEVNDPCCFLDIDSQQDFENLQVLLSKCSNKKG